MNTLDQNTHVYVNALWEKELAAKRVQVQPTAGSMEAVRQALLQRCADRKAQLIRGY